MHHRWTRPGQASRLGIVFALLLALSGDAFAQRARQRGPQRVPDPDKDVFEPAEPAVGMAQPLELVPRMADAIESNGAYYWTERIVSFQASFLKVHFVNLNLRAGDSLVLRSSTGRVVEEITGRGPKDMGTFWALSAFGDEITFEFLFQEPYDYLPFEIDQVIVGEEGLFARPELTESVCSAEDFDDAICSQGDPGRWSNVLASVGVMNVSGNPATALFCSGANVSPLNYILTNDHCVGSQSACDNTEFVFKYYRTACNVGAPTTVDWHSYRCNQIVASSPWVGNCEATLNDLDFNLCSVVGNPAGLFGYVEADPTRLTDGEDVYIVQHADGRPHEITEGGGSQVDVDGTVLRYYETLDTEGGSSGAPIFRESDDMLVGLHHCGGCETSGVGNRGMLMADIYPAIASFLCGAVPDIQITGTSFYDQVIGNDDVNLDPGEVWEFYPDVTNLACSAVAYDVTAELKKNPLATANILIMQGTAHFGDIAGGDRKTSMNPVSFMIREYAECGSTVILDLVDIKASGGGSFDDETAILAGEIGGDPVFTPFFDDFSSETISWSIVDGGIGSGPAQTWTTSNPGGRALSLVAPFYIVDADENGTASMDEQLITPVVDMTAYVDVELRFAHNFNWYSGGNNEQADVDIRSSATGGSWVNVVNYSGADASGIQSFDVSAFAAGQPDVQIRFHYYNASFEWWWAVDDVVFVATAGYSCDPQDEHPKKKPGFHAAHGDVASR